ncbi:MAG: hypothetical protein ACI8QS_003808 [Planctomycetota bacterium]|jgi:hypothetical protein
MPSVPSEPSKRLAGLSHELRNLVERTESGLCITVGLDRADDVRAELSAAGVEFREDDPDDCGCGGPVLACFRLS